MAEEMEEPQCLSCGKNLSECHCLEEAEKAKAKKKTPTPIDVILEKEKKKAEEAAKPAPEPKEPKKTHEPVAIKSPESAGKIKEISMTRLFNLGPYENLSMGAVASVETNEQVAPTYFLMEQLIEDHFKAFPHIRATPASKTPEIPPQPTNTTTPTHTPTPSGQSPFKRVPPSQAPPAEKPQFNTDNITWTGAQGDNGYYERASLNEEDNKVGIDLKNLVQHIKNLKASGKNGWFNTDDKLWYWLFTDNITVGRKEAHPPARRY